MKKTLLFLGLALLAVAAFLMIGRHRRGAASAAAWVPAGTIFFDEFPDIHRSEQRWLGTALAQIIHEPQVQAFLVKPESTVPGHDEIARRLDQLRKIDPVQFFFAATDWAGTNAPPKLVLGLSYAGPKDGVDSLVAELRKAALKAWPDGKSDIVKDAAGGEIETFTAQGITAGLAYRGQWVFMASDLDALKATLDGFAGRPGAQPSLADSAVFKSCLAQLPADPDAVGFMQPKLLADKLDALMATVQPAGNPHAMDSLRQIEAFAMGAKMDGALMREALCTLTSQKIPGASLANRALNLSTDSTLVYSDCLIDAIEASLSSQPGLDLTAMPPGFQMFAKQFQAQGLTLDAFKAAYGPEGSFLFDWPTGAPIPVPLVTMDVRDPAKARSFLDKALQTIPDANLSKKDASGATYYSMAPTSMGFFPLQVTVGVSDKFLAAGLTLQAVRDAMKRAGGPGKLGDSPVYKGAMAGVQAPTLNETYIDDKAIFERIYNLVRGVASMGMIPHSGDYLDLGKLPETDTIAHHLSPMAISSAVKEGGYLMQTAGPVPVYQGTVFLAVAAGAAYVPYMMSQSLHGVPSSQAQAPPFAPPVPSVPAPASSAPSVPAAASSPSASPYGGAQ